MNNKRVGIVIPIYKSSFDKSEKVSLKQLGRLLPNYDKIVVLPKKIKRLNISDFKYKTIHLNNSYFKSVQTYSELLTIKDFYKKFTSYEYILIYQLDAIILSANLDKFVGKFDYVGAPFFRPVIGFLTNPPNSPLSGGNGGLSLRKVASFIKVIELVEKEAVRSSDDISVRKGWFIFAVLAGKARKKWLRSLARYYPFNEDGFWSFEAKKYYPKFKVAPFKVALEFAFERFPEKCFRLNHFKLPLGTHAWKKHNPNFWMKHLKKI